jgi:spermidine synthase
MRYSSVLAVALAGFASAIGQVLIVREMLVLFQGNELTSGLILGNWLLWTAAGSGLGGVLSHRLPPRRAALALNLLVMGGLLPLTILFIRASRVIWAIRPGEVISPGAMLAICASGTFFFCVASGFLFASAWRVHVAEAGEKGGQPILIYLGEAAGAALGGLAFYFVLLPHASALTTALATAAVIVPVIAFLLWQDRSMFGHGPFRAGIIVAVPLLLAMASVYSPAADRISRGWQWGSEPLAVHDTPYHNLALLRNQQQLTLFANGLWLFSVPDLQSAEYAVHPALLQHPDPQSVLLMGGGAAGLVDEILKHPSVGRLDYVESDPEIIRMARKYMPAALSLSLNDARVHVFHADTASFVRNAPRAYDVVLLNSGDPVNAEMNRFYTQELFGKVRQILKPAGVFSFAVTSSPDIVGPAQTRLLRSLYETLRSAFPSVLVYPGEQARFFAGDGYRSLVRDPAELVRRIEARGLQLQYVREYYLFSNLSPMRLNYMESILRQGPAMPINKDFEPTCYFQHLIVWSAQLHPGLEQALEALSEIGWSKSVGALATAALLLLGVFFVGRPKPTGGVAVSVAVVGGALMVLEIVLLLGFQVLEGFLYQQLALIIASFMTGMALGAAGAAWLTTTVVRPRFWLVAVQATLCVFVLGVLKCLFVLQHHMQTYGGAPLPMSLIFSLMALTAGILGGLHFSLALKTVAGGTVPSAETAGKLYALDLVGAASGAVIASVFLLPLYGLTTTVWASAMLLGASLLTLLRTG